jgi:hypothetical protein
MIENAAKNFAQTAGKVKDIWKNGKWCENEIVLYNIVLTSVADQGCLSRIPDPDFYPSRIPDPKTATEERGEKK